jgi:hypothetical protein
VRRGRRRNAVSGTLKIELAATGSDITDAQRECVTEHLLLALGRFGGGVTRVTVRLSGEANPLGGFDTRCAMRAWLRSRGSVAVETVDGAAAIDRAVTRLAARVELALVDGGAETGALVTPVALASCELGTQLGLGRRTVATARRKRRT